MLAHNMCKQSRKKTTGVVEMKQKQVRKGAKRPLCHGTFQRKIIKLNIAHTEGVVPYLLH